MLCCVSLTVRWLLTHLVQRGPFFFFWISFLAFLPCLPSEFPIFPRCNPTLRGDYFEVWDHLIWAFSVVARALFGGLSAPSSSKRGGSSKSFGSAEQVWAISWGAQLGSPIVHGISKCSLLCRWSVPCPLLSESIVFGVSTFARSRYAHSSPCRTLFSWDHEQSGNVWGCESNSTSSPNQVFPSWDSNEFLTWIGSYWLVSSVSPLTLNHVMNC